MVDVMIAQPTHFVAARRAAKSALPDDWRDRVKGVKGVQVLSSRGRFLSINASSEAADDVQRLLGETVHVEPVMAHQHV